MYNVLEHINISDGGSTGTCDSNEGHSWAPLGPLIPHMLLLAQISSHRHTRRCPALSHLDCIMGIIPFARVADDWPHKPCRSSARVNGIIPQGPAQGVCSPVHVTQPTDEPTSTLGRQTLWRNFQHRCELESATLGWDLPNKVFRIIRARHFAPTLEVLVVLVWVVVVVTGTAVWLHFGSISSISSCTSMCGCSSHWHFGRTWEALERRRSPSAHSILSQNSPSRFNFDCSINESCHISTGHYYHQLLLLWDMV